MGPWGEVRARGLAIPPRQVVHFSSHAADSPRADDGGVVLSVLEVAGCAFVGFLYFAILATAVTRKTRRNPSQPAHPESDPRPGLDRVA